MICETNQLRHNVVGRFVLLFHHEDGVRHRNEAGVRSGISNDRFLIHLGDEWKKDLFFLQNMRIHFRAKGF